MKRLLVLLLMAAMLLSGCSLFSSGKQQPVLYYYQTANFRLGQSNGAIAAEERDGTGHITDLNYLLRLYLTGPLTENLISPFPADVQLTGVRTGQNKVTVNLTGDPGSLSPTQKTIACACLTLTCLDLTEEESVMIFWGDEIISMDRSVLTLFDSSAQISNQ